MSFEVIIIAIAFLSIIALVAGIYLLFFGKALGAETQANRRIQGLSENAEHISLEKLRKEKRQLQKTRGLPFLETFVKNTQKANLAQTPKQLGIYMLLIGCLSFVLLNTFTPASFFMCLCAGSFIGFASVYLWVSHKAKTRIALFEEQLPDAVELMVQSLKAGHPFSVSLQIVASEVADPLGTEFTTVSNEIAYGRGISETLMDVANRLEIQDMRFIAVAVGIQQQSGGNLGEILSNLAEVIRSRFRLFRRIKAITAEARFSSNFLSSSPLVVFGLINLLSPDYYDGIQDHPLFVTGCLLVVGFILANLVVMRVLTNIKV